MSEGYGKAKPEGRRRKMLSVINNACTYVKARFNCPLKDESGQGMVEYVLIIALIAVAVIAFLPGVATAINNVLTNITGKMEAAK
jgi:pilus assembly protein Flp/PilA